MYVCGNQSLITFVSASHFWRQFCLCSFFSRNRDPYIIFVDYYLNWPFSIRSNLSRIWVSALFKPAHCNLGCFSILCIHEDPIPMTMQPISVLWWSTFNHEIIVQLGTLWIQDEVLYYHRGSLFTPLMLFMFNACGCFTLNVIILLVHYQNETLSYMWLNNYPNKVHHLRINPKQPHSCEPYLIISLDIFIHLSRHSS